MGERKGIYTVGGHPVTLIGNEVKVGDQAPNFTAVDNNMAPAEFVGYPGKVVVLSAVLSLDTSVCDTETRKFNAAAAKLGPDVKIITLSGDLPFTQKRWCGAAGIDQVVTLSDYKDHAFGLAYGVLVKETMILARSVFVVDRQGVVRYLELVKEGGTEPNYDQVYAAVKSVV